MSDMNEAEIRVLIAEDHDQVRARIQRIVDAMPGIVVVGAAANGLTAVSTAKRLDPDVILMDISMPVLDGIHATRQIVDLGLRARVIALTSLEDDYTFHDALRAGVAGFLLKPAPVARSCTPSSRFTSVSPCSHPASSPGS